MCPRTLPRLCRSPVMTLPIWRSVLTSSQSRSASPQQSSIFIGNCIYSAQHVTWPVSSCHGNESHQNTNCSLCKTSLYIDHTSPFGESCLHSKTRRECYRQGDAGCEISSLRSNSPADSRAIESSAHLPMLPVSYTQKVVRTLRGHCQSLIAWIIKYGCFSLPSNSNKHVEVASLLGKAKPVLPIRPDPFMTLRKTRPGSNTCISFAGPMDVKCSLFFQRDFHQSASSRKFPPGLTFDVALLNLAESLTVKTSLPIQRNFHQSAHLGKTHPGLNIDVALLNLAEHGDDAQQLGKFKFQGMSLQEMMSLTEKDWEAMVDYRLLTEADVAVYEAHKAAMKKGERFYEDPKTGYVVMTRMAHLKRGTCCGNACRHCPFGHVAVNPSLRDKFKFNSAFFH